MNTRKLPHYINKKYRGAAMAEAVIVLLIFFAFVGAFLHWVLALHYRHTLADGMTTALRFTSTEVNTGNNNPTYDYRPLMTPDDPSALDEKVKKYLRKKGMLGDTSVLSTDVMQVCRDPGVLDCHMRLKMRWRHPCPLCMYPGLTEVVVQIESAFEDPCFVTTSPTDPNRGCADTNIPTCGSTS